MSHNRHFLGIDYHKRTSTWVLIDTNRTVVWTKTVLCRPNDISIAIKNMPVPVQELPVAIEPVCGYRVAVDIMKEHGMDVRIANPLKVRLIAESKQKTDKNDARTLADLLRTDYLPEAWLPDGVTASLRDTIRTRTLLVQKKVAAKNALHALVTKQGKDFNPVTIQGRKSVLVSKEEDQKVLVHTVTFLEETISTIDVRLQIQAKDTPDAQLLMSMPGIGTITAMTILAECGDLRRFRSAGAVCSYAGLVPAQRSSGDTVSFGHITHTGSRILRSILVEAAMRINATNAPKLLAFCEQIQVKGSKKRGRVALARKMLSIMYTMVCAETMYSESR